MCTCRPKKKKTLFYQNKLMYTLNPKHVKKRNTQKNPYLSVIKYHSAVYCHSL